jgi:hypothetical protein
MLDIAIGGAKHPHPISWVVSEGLQGGEDAWARSEEHLLATPEGANDGLLADLAGTHSVSLSSE